MRWIYLFVSMLLPWTGETAELKEGVDLMRGEKFALAFEQGEGEQFLISKDLKSKRVVSKVLVWPKGSDGSLFKIEEKAKGTSVRVFMLTGSDGDYSSFELVALDESAGKLSRLIGGDSFNVNLSLDRKSVLNVKLRQEDDAPDYGNVSIHLKAMTKTCEASSAQIEKINQEISSLVKKHGPVPDAKGSAQIEKLSLQKRKLNPTQISIDLSDFSKPLVDCK